MQTPTHPPHSTTVTPQVILLNRATLRAALMGQDCDRLAGKLRPPNESAALPVGQRVDEATDYLWAALTSYHTGANA